MISLSDKMPNALNMMKRGTGFLTFGTFTTILLFGYVFVGAIILTDNVLMGFDTFSETDLISAE